jgi:hypothetical protein
VKDVHKAVAKSTDQNANGPTLKSDAKKANFCHYSSESQSHRILDLALMSDKPMSMPIPIPIPIPMPETAIIISTTGMITA